MKLKRILACLIAVVLIAGGIRFPAAAADDGNFFAKVREKINVPDHFDGFHSEITMDKNKQMYVLNWTGETSSRGNGGSVSVYADQDGRIFSYNYYEYGNFEGDCKLSDIDFRAAQELAREAVDRICPEFAPSMVLFEQENYTARNDKTYTVVFYRHENGVPYYSNGIAAEVAAKDGTVRSLTVYWDDIASFPKPTRVISAEAAKTAFKNSIGVSPMYRLDGFGGVVLQCAPNMTGRNFIDAKTGEVIDTRVNSQSAFYPNTNFYVRPETWPQTQPVDQSIYISQNGLAFETAQSYVRQSNTLEITAEHTAMPPAYTVREDGEMLIEMVFSYGNGADTVSLTLDRDMLLVSYSDSSPGGGRQRRTNLSDAKATADKFLMDYSRSYYTKCTLYQTDQDGSSYTFDYRRRVNGLLFADNGIQIKVDKTSGAVQSMQVHWSNLPVHSAAGVLSGDEAADWVLQNAPLKLQYVAKNKAVSPPQSVNNVEMVPVYGFEMGKPAFLNAAGEQTYSNGAPYYTITSYQDMEHHFAKTAAQTLLGSGVLPQQPYFNPDEPVTQAEYLQWVSNAVSSGYGELNYIELVENGVLEAADCRPSESICVLEGVEYLLNTLGYKPVATLESTYKTDYFDSYLIPPDKLGYAAIAQGMGLVNGRYFNPGATLTRGQAAQILYNYLSN